MSGKNSPNSTNSPPTSTTNINNNLAYQRSSKEMSTSAAASAAATALALDLKPKHPISETAQPLLLPQLPLPQQNHLQQHQQKIKKCALTRKRITSFSKVLKRPLTRSFNQKLFSKTFKAFTTAKPLSNRFIPQFTTTFSSSNNPSILTKENFLFTLDLLAVVRRNASDKLKLIQMVHDNPILWDSRLPNFKGAEEEKNRAWEHIGKEFNAPGRRVARAFKSLRESYRRELAHVKLMGNNFKPKWSLYEAMDFLRDVIRERKGGSHAAEHNGSSLGLNLSALAHHMSSTVNNNMVNNNNNNNNNFTKPHYKVNALHSSFNDSALNLSKCSSSLNVSNDYYFDVKTELELSNQNANPNVHTVIPNGNSNNIAVNIPPAHQNSQHNDSRVSSTRNDSSNQNNNNFDDLDNCSVRSGEDGNSSAPNTALSHQGSDEVEELEAIDADFPYPLILNSNSPATNAIGSANKRKRKNLHSNADDEEEEEDDDDYEGQMLQQHRHLRAQQNQANGLAAAGLMTGMSDMMPPPQTVREVLNSKFCGFISAKLNSMEDSEADNLMNKILMLLVQSQMTQTTNNSALAIPNGQNEFK